ncbi:MAG TPA: histidine kinase [Thermoanaerobaculia bacterium]|nr:histidine kinase [Thermoanaerobaculia bacterium]
MPRTPRASVWLQLLIGWLPVGALFTTLLVTAHPEVSFHRALLVSLRMMVAAAALGLLVERLTERLPWPRPFRASFVAVHLAAAGGYAIAWLILNSVILSLLRWQPILVVEVGYGIGPFLVLGVWLYVMVAGVSYATQATERAAKAEALAARSRLASLRAQLNPHFLFNALHTVVHLIPRQPERAAQAAEGIADLLRTAIGEDRDLVPLAEELAFVERYLEIERLRFGDRLRVDLEIPHEAEAWPVPSFALLTLVENAVRHGAAPRVEPTAIRVTAQTTTRELRLAVHDTGAGATPEQLARGDGTGIGRLRDRLGVLYGGRARLDFESGKGGGFTAALVVPRAAGARRAPAGPLDAAEAPGEEAPE